MIRRRASEDGPIGETPKWMLENVYPHMRWDRQWAMSVHQMKTEILEFIGDDPNPQFWGWYCDYDWVVFCWIFGRMIDLPPNFPMFCRDFRHVVQMFGIRGKDLADQSGQQHDALADACWLRDAFNVFRTRLANETYIVRDTLA